MKKIVKGMEGYFPVQSGHLPAADYLREDQSEALKKFVEGQQKEIPEFQLDYCEWMYVIFYVSYCYGDKYEVGDGILEKEEYPALYEWDEDQWKEASEKLHK